MELQQLRCMVAVVDHGSFTRAAAALHITQPTLSYAINHLETELGVDLFHRVGRRVVLTSAGDAFVGPARRALKEIGHARSAVDEVAGLVAGRLSLVALRTLTVVIADLVGRFCTAHPGVIVHIHEPEGDAEVIDLIRSGVCELGTLRTDAVPTDFAAHPMICEEIVAIFPPATSPPDTVRIPELLRHPLVTLPAGSPTRAAFNRMIATTDPDMHVVAETPHLELIVELVRAGAGVSVVSRSLADRVAANGVIIRPFDPPLTANIAIAHRRGRLTPAAKAFLASIHPASHAAPLATQRRLSR